MNIDDEGYTRPGIVDHGHHHQVSTKKVPSNFPFEGDGISQRFNDIRIVHAHDSRNVVVIDFKFALKGSSTRSFVTLLP